MPAYKIQKPSNVKNIDPRKFSDRELYEKCQEYGMNAKVWLRRFAGLLPEVNRRKLYRKKGFISIYEFAKKLCGMNEFTVERILNLSSRLEDKPTLRTQFETGLQGWSKIETVSYIATPKTEKNWAGKVEKMSKRVLETYVSQYRKTILEKNSNQSGQSSIPGEEPELIPVISQEFKFLSFQLSREIEHKLRVFKQKLEKQEKENLSWNEAFTVLLSPEYLRENEKSKDTNQNAKIPKIPKELPKSSSRTIPAAIKKILQEKYGTYCAYPACNKPFEVYHHTKRFAITRNHDPKFIVPLCGLHHGLVHTGLIANETDPPENWRIKEKIDKTSLTALIDQRIQDFKPD